MIRGVIEATERALRDVKHARFFENERGYQGQFYCQLQAQLKALGCLPNDALLEIEYQKSARHGIYQRPDIILHIPAKRNEEVRQSNFAVWALKRSASAAEAQEDFRKLDEMFELLDYAVGFFVNIDSCETWRGSYGGRFPNRVVGFAVQLEGPDVQVISCSEIANTTR
jgi:hypothetical protein